MLRFGLAQDFQKIGGEKRGSEGPRKIILGLLASCGRAGQKHHASQWREGARLSRLRGRQLAPGLCRRGPALGALGGRGGGSKIPTKIDFLGSGTRDPLSWGATMVCPKTTPTRPGEPFGGVA